MAAEQSSDPERSSTPEPCSAAKRVRLYDGDSDSDSEVVHDMKMEELANRNETNNGNNNNNKVKARVEKNHTILDMWYKNKVFWYYVFFNDTIN